MSRLALSAERATEVIQFLTLHPTERFTLTEISQRLDINPSSTHALLMTLIRAGFVRRHPAHKTYTLGPALIAAGTAALEQLPGIRAAQAEIDDLGRELGVEGYVTTLADEQVIVVGNGPHVSAYGSGLILGQCLPLVPPIGLVFVAFWTPQEINRWLKRARPRLSKQESNHLLRVLDVIRRTGYSIALESEARRGVGEVLTRVIAGGGVTTASSIESFLAGLGPSFRESSFEEGHSYDISTIAATIFDPQASPIAAISLSGFPGPMVTSEVLELSERLASIARVITKRTHGRLPQQLE